MYKLHIHMVRRLLLTTYQVFIKRIQRKAQKKLIDVAKQRLPIAFVLNGRCVYPLKSPPPHPLKTHKTKNKPNQSNGQQKKTYQFKIKQISLLETELELDKATKSSKLPQVHISSFFLIFFNDDSQLLFQAAKHVLMLHKLLQRKSLLVHL